MIYIFKRKFNILHTQKFLGAFGNLSPIVNWVNECHYTG